jgi:hypothetical protein
MEMIGNKIVDIINMPKSMMVELGIDGEYTDVVGLLLENGVVVYSLNNDLKVSHYSKWLVPLKDSL